MWVKKFHLLRRKTFVSCPLWLLIMLTSAWRLIWKIRRKRWAVPGVAGGVGSWSQNQAPSSPLCRRQKSDWQAQLELKPFPHTSRCQCLLFNVISLVPSGEGNGTPLWYSCLENPMVGCSHGVAKSRTWLSDFTFTFHCHISLEKEMATHSSIPAWRIVGTGEPGGLPSMR